MTNAQPADPVTSARGPAQLAEQLSARGYVTDPAWREVFSRVPRHRFLPHAAVVEQAPVNGAMRLLSRDDPAQLQAWLEAVYSDRSLIVQIEGRPVEEAFAGGQIPKPGSWTSSSTQPGLMARMLHDLDVADGMKVLEIGTGTGYNAALLSERLGANLVTTIDVDADLTERARVRLAALGYRPTIIGGDGAQGYPAGGRYDRIIATVSWPWLPSAWVTQTAPGGKIMANILGQLGGAILLATVDNNGVAEGRFLPQWIGFISARGVNRHMRDITAVDTDEGSYDTTTTTIDPALIRDPAFAFLAQIHTQDAQPYWSLGDEGRPLTGLLTPDGSWAETYHDTDQNGRHQVDQGGPRRLWNQVEQAHAFWTTHGQPNWTHFGLTATTEHQYIWYESPNSDRTWQVNCRPA